jgi:heterodisulfide reductase subunit C
MTESLPVIDLDQLDHGQCRSWPFSQDFCMTCGMCASACPVSGVDGFDPRKLIRLISLGLEQQAVDSRWPWICTMCGKCENVCPMEISIPDIVRQTRALRDRDAVPGHIHKGVAAALETGNNLRLPREDYEFIIEDVAEEVSEEPGFE